ncbi:unnamed protein product [Withania somnifera]
MSLSCLTCKISRTDSANKLNSKKFYNVDKNSKGKHKVGGPCLQKSVERSWSGNLAAITSSGSIDFPIDTPKLVRSPGIRRDWSFEDLQRQIVR